MYEMNLFLEILRKNYSYHIQEIFFYRKLEKKVHFIHPHNSQHNIEVVIEYGAFYSVCMI